MSADEVRLLVHYEVGLTIPRLLYIRAKIRYGSGAELNLDVSFILANLM